MIEIFSGPPYNFSFERIGWLNCSQIAAILRHRDASGRIDFDALEADQRLRQSQPAKSDETDDGFAAMRFVRRMQGWPEYLIDKIIRDMTEASKYRGRHTNQRQHAGAGKADRSAARRNAVDGRFQARA